MKPLSVLLVVLSLAVPVRAEEKIRVLTSLTDLREIAREVGAGRVEATSLLHGPEDPHFVDAKPSFIRMAPDADLFVLVGLDLEVGYAPLLLESSRNPRIQKGQPGYLEVQQGVRKLGVPSGPIDRSMGDVHPGGNPHFWLDPASWKEIAAQIAGRLRTIAQLYASAYDGALADFRKKVDDRLAGWSSQLAALRGQKVVSYHDDVPYLAARFGFTQIGSLEPKPGVSPTPSHLAGLIVAMQQEQVGLILRTVYQPTKVPDLVAQKTGARVVLIAHMVGSVPEATDLWSEMDYNAAALPGGRQ